MKINIDFQNGMELKLKPEQCQLAANENGTALVTKTNEQQLVLLFFPGAFLATPEELEARKSCRARQVKTPQP